MGQTKPVRQRKTAAQDDGTSASKVGMSRSSDDGRMRIALITGLATLLLAAAGIGVLRLFWWIPAASTSGMPVWVEAGKMLDHHLQANVSCAHRTEDVNPSAAGVCAGARRDGLCARFVIDDAVSDVHVAALREFVEWLIKEAWGAGSGPPSVIDLQNGAISYKDKFVELEAFMDFKKLEFSEAHVQAYTETRRALHRLVAQLFGLPESELLQDMTFFSHINSSKTPQTVHDEYWHRHIDTEQYGTFEYTTLLYLSTEGKEFDGGDFVFEGADAASSLVVKPRRGRLVVFSSDAENPHHVEKVSRGIRITLTSAFTCNKEKAQSLPPFPRPGRAGGERGIGVTE